MAALLSISTVHATIINVQSSADGAANAANCPGAGCRLRDALAKAVDNDVIQFSVAGAITLTNGELMVQNSISIVGLSAGVSAVDGNAASRVFHIAQGKTVSITGLTIRNGSANTGGGIYNDHATLTLTDSIVSGNTATGNGNIGGGGIYNDGDFGSVTLTITNSTLSGNSSPVRGGGIYNNGFPGNASLTINNSTLSGNSAAIGGAIYNIGQAGNASVTLTNSTLSGNSASNAGGGIYAQGQVVGDATLILNNSTLNGNSAQPGNGGAIQTFVASVTIGNTILNAGGASGVNILNDGGGHVTSSGYNLSSDVGVTNINGGTGSLSAITDQKNTDPKLAPLGDNGGPTFTHALLIGSPAIDKGKDLSGTGFDQRGRTRPHDDPTITNATGGDGSDIGAFELYTVKVTNNKDDNSTETLRKALADVLPGDGIYFDPSLNGQVITLTTGELLASKSVDISGLGAANLAVDGNAASRVFHIAVGTTVTISGLTIRNGASGQGGGVLNDHATLTLINSTLSGNSATNGAAVFNAAEGGKATLTVTNSTLSGNSAAGGASGQGGGVYNDGGFAGDATLTLTNSTISGNSSTAEAGGIFNLGFQGTAMLKLTNCTLSNNSSGAHGGGIYNFGGSGSATLELGNTILKTGTSGENILNDSGTVTSDGHNLSSDAGVTTDNGGTGSLNATGDQINTDPKLRPLANYGGPTLTYALLPGSPALDAGDNTLALNAGLTTDGRGAGFSRVLDAASDADTTQTVDIGAFEADPSVEDISDKSTNEDTPLSFTFHVGDDNANSTPFDIIFGTSTDTTLVPNGNIQVTGNSGTGQRTLTIMPAANLNGVVTIAVTVIKTINNKVLSVADTFVLTVVPTPTPTPTATATATPTATATATPTVAPSSTPSPTPRAAQSLNISTRLNVGTGDKLMIAGFIITGNATKPVLLRAMGPSLAAFGINNVLLDPVLELRDANSSLMFNDNWVDSPQRSQFEGTVFQPGDDRESVVVGNLAAGNYTALLTGKNNTGGVGIIEAYDRDQAADAQLANISTRGFVDTGANVMIGGFILGGSTNNTRVAVRAKGPSLAQFGLNPVLQDPTLELRDANGATLIANDNWLDDPISAAALTANGLGLGDAKESGIFTALPPGQFTAILAGTNGGVGIGLVEIYNLQ